MKILLLKKVSLKFWFKKHQKARLRHFYGIKKKSLNIKIKKLNIKTFFAYKAFSTILNFKLFKKIALKCLEAFGKFKIKKQI